MPKEFQDQCVKITPEQVAVYSGFQRLVFFFFFNGLSFGSRCFVVCSVTEKQMNNNMWKVIKCELLEQF